jgi:hypothetical protein
MSKKKVVVENTETIETIIESIMMAEPEIKVETNVENIVTKQLGRPVNPDSVRQKRINEMEAKRAAGELKRGRPTVAGSKRQEVLAARAIKIAEFGELKQGRPVNMDSKRQQMLMAKAMELAKKIIAEQANVESI